MRSLILVFAISLVFISCKKEMHEGFYDHGEIVYKITYLNEDNGNFDPSLLPKKMTMTFDKDYCSIIIDGFMGFFKLENTTSFKKKKSTTQLKVLDKRYLFYGGRNELMCCFDSFEDMIIKNDTTTKTIAGLKSQRGIAAIPALKESFDIYYTNDISINDPNITNPYRGINGILTEFVLNMGPYKMRFEAQEFNPDKFPDEKLKISDKTVEVSREEMVYALERLMK
ncbi:MAG: hypothetical protein JXA77_07385 [Bacteroidales bacterium]|nr:hypothetical protein [Bacteroidales bacterium]